MKIKLSKITVVSSAIFFIAPIMVFAQGLPLESLMPGSTQGTGTYFEITDSEYLNIFLQGTEEITVSLESIPKTISLIIKASTSTNSTTLIIGGLKSNKTYYKFEDSYKNETEFIADGNGSHAFIQDLTRLHNVWFQETGGIVFLPEDCSSYGNWDPDSSTCTLNQNVTSSVEITADGITLDCGNHNITSVSTSTGEGIYLNHRSGVTVKDCGISNFSHGIVSFYSSNNHINGNNVSGNSIGIALASSPDYDFSQNDVFDNLLAGFSLSYSPNGYFRSNAVSGSRYNLAMSGANAQDYIQDIDTSNTVNGKPIYYLVNEENRIIDASSNAGFVGVVNSRDITIRDLKLTNNLSGVLFVNVNDSKIENVTTSNNRVGINLIWSSANTLNKNTALNNDGAEWGSFGIVLGYSYHNTTTDNKVSSSFVGIYLANSSYNTLDGNEVSGNPYGIYFTGSNYNKVFHNNFLNNPTQAFVYGGTQNLFDNDYPEGGNHWSDFDTSADGCVDANNDSICDSPYTFTGGQDRYPFMEESGWAVSPVPTYNIAVILAEPANVSYGSNSITAQPCKLLPEKTYPNGHGKEYYQDLAYCVVDYHKENSFGTFNLDFEIFDNNSNWFKTNKNEVDYLTKENEFVIDAINLATSTGIDLSDKDMVIIVYSGGVYAHTWSLDSQPLGYPPYKIIIAEEDLVGAWTHEIGHIVGALTTPENTITPDLSRNDIPMGFVEKWDLMARGSWNNSGNDPPNMSSYTKEFLDWLKENIYPKSAYGEYWINSLETSEYGGQLFRYNLEDNINTSTQKYYILEVRNRNLKTWDSSLPGLPVAGDKHLIVYYVDTKGLPEYGYVTTTSVAYQEGMMWNQYRKVTIPGNNPQEVLETNDGVLNPIINETYEDLDNLVKFTAITDRIINDRYELKTRIEEITHDSFTDKLWGVILRPSSIFEQRIKTIPSIFNADSDSAKNQIGMPLREAPGAGIVRIVKFLFWSMTLLILLSLLLLIFYKSKRVTGKKKNVFKIIWIVTLIVITAFIASLFLKPVLIKRIEQSLPPFPEGVIPMPLAYATSPDLDLHFYCTDRKHIGMNYETGEYEIQIAEAMASGDNQDTPEWILIPPEVTGCHFTVSSYDNQKFLEENPDIAQQMEDKTDSYEAYARYIDPETAIYTSSIISETIKPGAELEHPISGTADISIQKGVVTIDTLRREITNARDLGLIDNQGIANGLLQKLDSAEKKINQKSFRSAKNTLNALKNEINAQKSKHITEDAANTLLEDLNSIIQSITLNTNNGLSVLIADIQAIFMRLINLLPELIRSFI